MAVTQNENSEIPLLRLIPLINRITESHKQEDHKYTKSQRIIMLALYYRGLLTMSQIASVLDSSKEQATRAVSHLVDEGIVKRIELPENRKHVYVELTGKGKESIENYNKIIRGKIKQKIDASLSEDEVTQLKDSVNTAISLLSKLD